MGAQAAKGATADVSTVGNGVVQGYDVDPHPATAVTSTSAIAARKRFNFQRESSPHSGEPWSLVRIINRAGSIFAGEFTGPGRRRSPSGVRNGDPSRGRVVGRRLW